MRKYCRAYYLRDLRKFSAWSEKPADQESQESELTDDAVCYLWDDFTVVRNPIQQTGVIFDAITPEWQDFCHRELKFAIPEDLLYAYTETEQQTREIGVSADERQRDSV